MISVQVCIEMISNYFVPTHCFLHVHIKNYQKAGWWGYLWSVNQLISYRKGSFSCIYQLFLRERDTHIDRDLLKRTEPAKTVSVQLAMDQLFLCERDTHIEKDLLKRSELAKTMPVHVLISRFFIW